MASRIPVLQSQVVGLWPYSDAKVKIEARELAMLVVSFGEQQGAIYRRVAGAVAELIDRGDLPPGCALPAERALALALEVSRTTVVAAYRELQELGAIERRIGSGTRVSDRTDGDRSTVSRGSVSSVRLASQFLHATSTTIDLATVAMAALPMVAETASAVDLAAYRRLTSRSLHDVRGLAELRAIIAERYCRDGLPTTEAQIMVTSGGQHALEVIAEGCLQQGDLVLAEMPTYRGALEAFGRVGARVEGVRLDRHGIVIGDLDTALSTRRPRMVFVQTQVQNPTGLSLAPQRARRLLELAEAHGVLVVDDRSLADTSFGARHPAIAGRGAGSTISIGSANKLFWNGLRVGWIRADDEVISRLARMKGATEVGASLLSQHLTVRLLGQVDRARAERSAELHRSYGEVRERLNARLTAWTWWEPSGGPSLWLTLPHGDASTFAAHAMRLGVAVLPEAVFAAEGIARPNRHIRLQFALPEAQLDLGIERLAVAWQSFARAGHPGTPVRAASD
jgi:DNA-binding transcriptional MocR family regulator